MATYRQDLPPKEGFGKIDWQAKSPTRLMRGYTQLFLFTAITAAGWIGYYFWLKRHKKIKLEMMDARIAVEPFLTAEKDRAYLKHLRQNRDEENEVMKNVPGWKTGTLWGEPVYHNVRGRFISPASAERLVHQDPKYVRYVINRELTK